MSSLAHALQRAAAAHQHATFETNRVAVQVSVLLLPRLEALCVELGLPIRVEPLRVMPGSAGLELGLTLVVEPVDFLTVHHDQPVVATSVPSPVHRDPVSPPVAVATPPVAVPEIVAPQPARIVDAMAEPDIEGELLVIVPLRHLPTDHRASDTMAWPAVNPDDGSVRREQERRRLDEEAMLLPPVTLPVPTSGRGLIVHPPVVADAVTPVVAVAEVVLPPVPAPGSPSAPARSSRSARAMPMSADGLLSADPVPAEIVTATGVRSMRADPTAVVSDVILPAWGDEAELQARSPNAPNHFAEPITDMRARAEILARAMASDLALMRPDWTAQADMAHDDDLRTLWAKDVASARKDYVRQVGEEIAGATRSFEQALNDELAKGRRIFG